MGIAIAFLLVFVGAPLMFANKTMGGAGVIFTVCLFGGVGLIAKLCDEQPNIGFPLLFLALIAFLVWWIRLMLHKDKIFNKTVEEMDKRNKEAAEYAKKMEALFPHHYSQRSDERMRKLMELKKK